MVNRRNRAVRHVIKFLIFGMIGIVLSGCTESIPIYNPGSYVNESEGYHSTLNVEVTVDEFHILNITILSHEEPTILADIVFEKLPPRIIKANGVDVDVISGATYTSDALLRAVEKALTQAKRLDE